MSIRPVWIAAALSAGLLAGCAGARPSKYYQLSMPGEESEAASDPRPYDVTLLIGPFSAPHLYREDHIVYRASGDQMGTYLYQRWGQPPTEMLEEILLRELRASGQYRLVDIEHSSSRGDYVLVGRLYDFEEIEAASPAARVTWELQMRDIKTSSVVWTHYYSHDEPASGKDMPAVVSAMDRNTQRAVGEIKSSLAQYFSSHQINLATTKTRDAR